MITVKIGKVPGRATEVMLEDGSNVAKAIEVAEITNYANMEIRVNGAVADVNTTLSNNAVVSLAEKVKGNA